MSIYQEFKKGMRRETDAGGERWVICESGIVTDTNDPDRQHRIKVILPSIDEDNQHDDWIRPSSRICLGEGFGSVFLPEKGQEVLVTGVLGDKYNFVYEGAVYNESQTIPEELNADWPGIKVPKNLVFIATMILRLAAQTIEILADGLVKIQGENIEATASSLAKLKGENATLEATQAAAVMGNTVTIHADGSISIQANGNVSISANGNVAATASGNMTLQGRTVQKVGPPI